MNSRILELDTFRGIAVLMVVLYHYTTWYNSVIGHTDPIWINFPFGHYGVQLFFVISGFVIFMTINRSERSMDFVISRGARLYPVYWASVILTFSVMYFYGLQGKEQTLIQAVINLTMLQQHFGVKHIDGVYWTLTYEFIFYTLIFFVHKFGYIKKIVPICIVWLLLQFSSAIIEKYTGYFPWKITFYFVLLYANLFSAGIFFYLLAHNKNVNYLHPLIGLCALNQYLVHGLESTIVILIVFTLFYLTIYNKLTKICNRPLLFLGTISYSLYLIHQYLGWVLLENLGKINIPSNLSVIITLSAAILIASALTFTIEKPANRWLRRKYQLHKESKGL